MILSWLIFPLLTYAATQFAHDPPGALRQGLSKNVISGYGRKLQATVNPVENSTYAYEARYIDVPVDHFQDSPRYEPHVHDTYPLRYYYDAKHYLPGGPVIVLASGEASILERRPYLAKGIINILAEATNGIGVLLEHRFYGDSIPTADFSTESLRFLTTEQAVNDAAWFAQNVAFPNVNVTAGKSGTPWIIYGGSYAGAFAAIARKTFPDVFWGGIGSSATTQAVWDFWQYYEPIRENAPPPCVHLTEELIALVDLILFKKDEKLTQTLKEGFGLEDLTYDDDFANAISNPIAQWQYVNWDPAVNVNTFGLYCSAITTIQLSDKSLLTSMAPVLDALNIPPSNGNEIDLTTALLNFMTHISLTVPALATSNGQTVSSYLSTHDPAYYSSDTLLDGAWRAWPYQYCTEWGFLQSGSGAPPDVKPLVSRIITPEYMSLNCQYAFNLTTPANTDLVNQYGGLDIAFPRLAFVDGTADPWLYATPGSPLAKPRANTQSEPAIRIDKAVHHWDENGLTEEEKKASNGLPPASVKAAQDELVATVQSWMKDWLLSTAETKPDGIQPGGVPQPLVDTSRVVMPEGTD